MSDLISRNDLLKKFNDTGIHIEFDLPVEEILGEDVDIDDFTMLVQDAIQAYRNMVIGTIKDMPIAYDVEKVVAEIEERRNNSECEYCKHYHNGMKVCWEDCTDAVIDDLLDIVRKGGVE